MGDKDILKPTLIEPKEADQKETPYMFDYFKMQEKKNKEVSVPEINYTPKFKFTLFNTDELAEPSQDVRVKKEEAKEELKKRKYEFYWSPQLEMLTGAKNLKAFYEIFFDGKENALKDTFLEKTLLGRAIKGTLFDFPMASSFRFLQHEHFGHGAEARALGGDNSFYLDNYNLLLGLSSTMPSFYTKPVHAWKYGHSSPSLSLYHSFEGWQDSYEYFGKMAKVNAGGFEAEKVMTDLFLEQMHKEGKTDHISNMGFLTSKLWRSSYVFTMSSFLDDPNFYYSTWDPDIYVKNLYYKYWFDKRYFNAKFLTRGTFTSVPAGFTYEADIYERTSYFGPTMNQIQDHVKMGALWNAISPAAWKAIADEWNYLFRGKKEFSMPKSFLDTDFNLGPWGSEYYLNCYTHTINSSPQKFYISHNPIGEKSYGAGMKTFSKPDNNNTVTALGFDVWHQEGKLGGNIEVELKKKLLREFFLNLHLGYKTEGYKVGYPENAGSYWGIGASARF